VYFRLTDETPDSTLVVDTIETIYPVGTDVDVVSRDESRLLTEVRQESWFGSLLADYGGIVRRAEATPEETTIVVELPAGINVRSVVNQLQERDPDLDLEARRQHQQPDRTPEEMAAQLSDQLTDRQLEVLETALAAGYFDWPREHSAEEVADRLDIAQPTLGKHLRMAEKQTFELLLER
jgi:predicted DNA binding protein